MNNLEFEKQLETIQPIINRVIYKYPNYLWDDLRQDALEHLYRTHVYYDPSKGVPFKYYCLSSFSLYIKDKANSYLDTLSRGRDKRREAITYKESPDLIMTVAQEEKEELPLTEIEPFLLRDSVYSRIFSLYLLGLSLHEIGYMLGMPYKSVLKRFKRYGNIIKDDTNLNKARALKDITDNSLLKCVLDFAITFEVGIYYACKMLSVSYSDVEKQLQKLTAKGEKNDKCIYS